MDRMYIKAIKSPVSLFRGMAFCRVAALFAISCFGNNAQAGIFWSEDWEGTGAEIARRWPETSCGNAAAWPDNNPIATNSSPARSRAVAYSGTNSLQYHFTGLQPTHGGCAAVRTFPPSDEIWMRWYERWGTGMQTAGGSIGGAGTKRHYMYNQYGYYGHCFVYMWGSRQLSFAVQSVYDAAEGRWGTQTLSQNAGSFSMPENQWVCYEAHLKYNTPGQADGVYEGWATNMTTGGPTIQFAKYTGRQWRGTSTSDPMPSTATWGSWKVYTQDGMGDIYDDLYAVGNTRCGCGGPLGIEEGKQATAEPKQLSIETKAGKVRFVLPQQGTYLLSVHDLAGREVWKDQDASSAGAVEWNYGQETNTGVYVVRLQTGMKTMNKKFCIVR